MVWHTKILKFLVSLILKSLLDVFQFYFYKHCVINTESQHNKVLIYVCSCLPVCMSNMWQILDIFDDWKHNRS